MAERPKGYGMTAELQAKKDAKYDPVAEQEAKDWIEAVTGERIGGATFHEGLKDGVILCKLANKLQPGSVAKFNTSKMAFKMMENIGKFLSFTEAYGCNKVDMFQTVDLYEDQNMPQVINAIHALGRKAQAKGFSGPTLGPKESAANKREFTEEQLKEGQNVIGLQMGTNKGASAAGQNFGLGRQIKS
ncbi:myophilin-like [Patiria miniata]|uniref:Calponin-homology (CH) domain-containing protein n=1 Tax=Patiria miniata TaxID=46514 RepID=A0A914AXE4_PATMI|nr:myophilin-like [Patiria miniata]